MLKCAGIPIYCWWWVETLDKSAHWEVGCVVYYPTPNMRDYRLFLHRKFRVLSEMNAKHCPWRVDPIPLKQIKLGHYRTILLPRGSRGIVYFWRLVSPYEGGTTDLAILYDNKMMVVGHDVDLSTNSLMDNIHPIHHTSSLGGRGSAAATPRSLAVSPPSCTWRYFFSTHFLT